MSEIDLEAIKRRLASKHYAYLEHTEGDLDGLITELEQARKELAAAQDQLAAARGSLACREAFENKWVPMLEHQRDALKEAVRHQAGLRNALKRMTASRDRLIERSKQLTQARCDRDHWCTDALKQTVRADKAEADLAAAQERVERNEQALRDLLNRDPEYKQAFENAVAGLNRDMEAALLKVGDERDAAHREVVQLREALNTMDIENAESQQQWDADKQELERLRGLVEANDKALESIRIRAAESIVARLAGEALSTTTAAAGEMPHAMGCQCGACSAGVAAYRKEEGDG